LGVQKEKRSKSPASNFGDFAGVVLGPEVLAADCCFPDAADSDADADAAVVVFFETMNDE
jgi:hypothetical protein